MSQRIGPRAWTAIAIAYFCACLVLGGASAAGVLANLVLQLGAVAMIATAMARIARPAVDRMGRAVLVIVALILLLPLLQLLPLPAALADALPGHGPLAGDRAALGIAGAGGSISLSPSRTLASWLSLLPPVAVFLSMWTLSAEDRLTAARGFGIVVAVAALLGVLQVGSGAAGYYAYAVTNQGSSVGFFANRNHMATLLLTTIPLTGLFLRSATRAPTTHFSAIGRRVIVGVVIFLLILSIVATGSRAGLLLLLPALALTYVSFVRTTRGLTPGYASILLLVVAGLAAALLFYGPFYDRIIDRSADFQNDVRYWAAPVAWRAGLDFFPFGSGFGTFDPVFRRAAGDSNLGASFVNHAHNDYLELFLTGGLPAVLLLAAVLAWLVAALRANWGMKSADTDALARAGAIIIAVILLHSLIDYPARTAAIAAIFAFAAALQLRPAGIAGGAPRPPRRPPPDRRPISIIDLRVR